MATPKKPPLTYDGSTRSSNKVDPIALKPLETRLLPKTPIQTFAQQCEYQWCPKSEAQPNRTPSKNSEDRPRNPLLNQFYSRLGHTVKKPAVVDTVKKPTITTLTNKVKTPFNTKFNTCQTKTPNISLAKTPAAKTPNIIVPEVKPPVSLKTPSAFVPATTNVYKPIATNVIAPSARKLDQTVTKSANKSTGSEHSIRYQVRVNDKTYKILRKLGSGGSSKVYEGFEPTTAKTVAIKIINMARADPKTQESYFNEKSLLTKLRDSKHVVRLFDSEYKSDNKDLILVMEKGDTDFASVMESCYPNRNKMIDGLFIKFYWRGMVQAVCDIHQHGIIHADLKPVNFILVKNEIKLIDFGIANAVDPDETSIIRDFQIGTVNYMAPEALLNRAPRDFINNENRPDGSHKRVTIIKYNTKVDIWSLGCILYNMVYGRPPYDKYQDVVVKIQAITNPRHQIDYPTINNPNLLDCMKSCLRHHPADRPTAKDLLSHPYLQEDILILDREPHVVR